MSTVPAIAFDPGDVRRMPLTPSQQGILLQTLAFPERRWHEETVAVDLRGRLDRAAFMAAWTLVVARHEALRASLHLDGEWIAAHEIHANVQLPWQVEDWSRCSAAEQSARLRALAEDVEQWPLHLAQAPPMRLALVILADDVHRFIWKHHHVLLDGWSVGIVLRELFDAYDVLARAEQPALPSPPAFSQYLGWLQQQDSSRSRIFWKSMLGTLLTPTRVAASPGQGGNAGPDDTSIVDVQWPDGGAAALQRRAEQWQVGPVAILHAAWALLLHRWCGGTDVTYGATFSGRGIPLEEAAQTVGLLMNTLPIRVAVSEEDAAMAVCQRIHAALGATAEHEWNALGQAIEWSGTAAETPLFDTVVVVETYPERLQPRELGKALAIARVESRGGRTAFPVVVITTVAPQLGVRFVLDRSRLGGEVGGLVAGFVALLDGILQRGERMRVGRRFVTAAPETDPPPTLASSADEPSPIEAHLATLWSEVLGAARMDAAAPLFAAGGHSLSVLRLLERVRTEFGVDLPLAVVFSRGSTIAALARVLEEELIAQASDEELAVELARIQAGTLA